MSSTPRSTNEAPPSTAEEDEDAASSSPGRYSMSTGGSRQMAAVRIDSTHIPAVRAPLAGGPPRKMTLRFGMPAVQAPPLPEPHQPEPIPHTASEPPDVEPTVFDRPTAVAPSLDSKTAAAPAKCAAAAEAAEELSSSALADAPPSTEPPCAVRAGTSSKPSSAVAASAAAPAGAVETEASDTDWGEEGTVEAAQTSAEVVTSGEIEVVSSGDVGEVASSPEPVAAPASEPSLTSESRRSASLPPPAASDRQASLPPPAPSSRRAGSLPPPPPPSRRGSGAPPSFDEGSIAHAFDALVAADALSLPGRQTVDLAPVRELFAELAANHMRHVRDFMIDVKWGEATCDWIEICLPAVMSLRRAAEKLDLNFLSDALEAFAGRLEAAASSGHRHVEGEWRERLLETYDVLVRLLPQSFALERDKSRREMVIVQALLLQVPDVRKVTIDKLYATGLTTLDAYFAAAADDIAECAGIAPALAARIAERFQAYRREIRTASPHAERAAERDRLGALADKLRDEHASYEDAANSWSPDAKARKRDRFRAREETWLAIRLLLARLGEVDRLHGIEKVPYASRLAMLEAYLKKTGAEG